MISRATTNFQPKVPTSVIPKITANHLKPNFQNIGPVPGRLNRFRFGPVRSCSYVFALPVRFGLRINGPRVALYSHDVAIGRNQLQQFVSVYSVVQQLRQVIGRERGETKKWINQELKITNHFTVTNTARYAPGRRGDIFIDIRHRTAVVGVRPEIGGAALLLLYFSHRSW